MLKQPFSGKELFTIYEMNMRSVAAEDAEELWEEHTGKTKKQAWNNLAKTINSRMQMEAIGS